jgi:predicted small integral membrane protein
MYLDAINMLIAVLICLLNMKMYSKMWNGLSESFFQFVVIVIVLLIVLLVFETESH